MCLDTYTAYPALVWAELDNVSSLDSLFRNPRLHPEYSFTKTINSFPDVKESFSGSFKLDLSGSRAFVSRYFGQGLRPIIWFNAGEPEEYLWRLMGISGPNSALRFHAAHLVCSNAHSRTDPLIYFSRPRLFIHGSQKLSAEHLIEPTLERKTFSGRRRAVVTILGRGLVLFETGPAHE